MLKFCPECGSKINGGKFCSNCGANLTKYNEGSAIADGVNTNSEVDGMLGNLFGFGKD